MLPYFETDMGRLYKGDAMQILREIPDNSVDAVITDIPYNCTDCKWDNSFKADDFSELLRVASGAVITFTNFSIGSELSQMYKKQFRYELIWQKTRAVLHFNAHKMPMRNHEFILIFGDSQKINYTPQKFNIGIPYYRKNKVGGRKGGGCYSADRGYYAPASPDGSRFPMSVLSFKPDADMTNNNKNRHPTQKPIAGVEWLIKSYSLENAIILDPYLGSGTTAVACEKLGRRWIGIEKEPEYCEIAKKRITAELTRQKQTTLFEGLEN